MSEHEGGMSTTAPPKVAIAGGTGLIGGALADSFRSHGHAVVSLTRRPERPEHVGWDPARGVLDAASLQGFGVVVNVTGSDIGRRWTPAVRAAARESRVGSTALLAKTLASLRPRPDVFINASAIGFYGDRGDEPLTEASAPGSGFLADLVRDWEGATAPAADAGIRVVLARFGLVLTRAGGVLPRLLTPFQLGIGGRIGTGNQWMSWIALPDLENAVRFAISTPGLTGPVNVASPNPARNREFTRALGSVLRRPTLVPVPERALTLVFGEMAESTLLASQRVVPEKLRAAGFRFRYPDIREALRTVIETRGR
jgi:uncharacterized protein